jgi:heme oxygenase
MMYNNDPRKMTAKYSSNCPKSKAVLKKDTTIYYWSSSREAFCPACCCETEYRRFLSLAADEDAMNVVGCPNCG